VIVGADVVHAHIVTPDHQDVWLLSGRCRRKSSYKQYEYC
jgi:hypothetical protein